MNLSLLEVISTKGVIQIEEFKQLSTLYIKEIDENSNISSLYIQMLYYLDALGHCEYDFDSRKIYICKPSIVLLPGRGNIRAVLTGARTKLLIEIIKKSALKFDVTYAIDKHETKNLLLPETILLEAYDENSMAKFAEEINVNYIGGIPISWIIANTSGTLDEYISLLPMIQSYDIRWEKRYYNSSKLCFQTDCDTLCSPYLVEYTNPISKQKIYVLVYEGYSKKVERDWGRYVILNSSKINVLLFNERKQILAVPSYTPLPKLLARAATLCSGRNADRIQIKHDISFIPYDMYFDLYFGVDSIMAKLIAKKINQELIFNDFAYREGEVHD